MQIIKIRVRDILALNDLFRTWTLSLTRVLFSRRN